WCVIVQAQQAEPRAGLGVEYGLIIAGRVGSTRGGHRGHARAQYPRRDPGEPGGDPRRATGGRRGPADGGILAPRRLRAGSGRRACSGPRTAGHHASPWTRGARPTVAGPGRLAPPAHLTPPPRPTPP